MPRGRGRAGKSLLGLGHEIVLWDIESLMWHWPRRKLGLGLELEWLRQRRLHWHRHRVRRLPKLLLDWRCH